MYSNELGWTPWQHVVGNEFVWCAPAARWRPSPDAPPVAQQVAASSPAT